MGYQNNTLASDGQQIKSTACFVTIGVKDAAGNDCVRLSDLKVTGYEEDQETCAGDVWIDMLHTNGDNLYVEGVQKSYFWYDNVFKPAGWYDEDQNPLADDESVLGNAEDITFEIGEGLCLNTANEYNGCQLVCSGQVYDKQVQYTLKMDGQQFVGNPLPRAVKLSELSISGYEEDQETCAGDVWIDMLHTNGDNLYVEGVQKSYFWYDNVFKPAGWYDEDQNPLTDDESVLGNAEDIEFAMGEGICFNTANDYNGCIVVFPAPTVK